MRSTTQKKSVWYYIKNYKFNSILIKNFMYIIVFVTLPLFATVYANYRNFNREMNVRMQESNMDLLIKSSTVIDNIVSDVLTVSEEMMQNDDFLFLFRNSSAAAQYTVKAERINGKIQDYLQHYPYVDSICLYSERNQVVLDGYTLTPIKEFAKKDKWYDIYKAVPMDNTYTLVGSDGNILFCTPVFRNSHVPAGVCVINVDTRALGMRLESEDVPLNRSFFILDISGHIMYCSNSDTLFKTESEKQEYRHMIGSVRPLESTMISNGGTKVVSVAGSGHKSWKYALITAMPLYTEELAKIRNFLFSSVMTGLLPSILAAYLITFITYRPVKKIINVIEKPHENWGGKEGNRHSNELLYITSNILNTLDSKEKIAEELEERMKSLRMAQSMALQFQIDPHFLYNTLDTIKWMSIEDMGSGNRTSKMITKVARLYRIGLETENVILPLREEIEFLKLYIDILEVRYSGRICFVWQIEEAFYECRVIKLCIQPLIENAVKHGLKPRMYHGTIWIRAEKSDGRLCIYVEDDGPGMTDSEIAAMNQNFMKRNGFHDANVGLSNINERIKLLYGSEFGVQIAERGEGMDGISVRLTFPVLFTEKQ